jgi:hypothetical protein
LYHSPTYTRVTKTTQDEVHRIGAQNSHGVANGAAIAGNRRIEFFQG